MPISFQCPHCGRSFCVPDEMAETQARCKTCGQTLTVPKATSTADDPWDWENNPPARLAPVRAAARRRSTAVPDAPRLPLIAAGVVVGSLLVGVLIAITALLNWSTQPPTSDPMDGDLASSSVPDDEPSGAVADDSMADEYAGLVFSDNYDWRKVVCPEGEYSVMMPGQPEDQVLGMGSRKALAKIIYLTDKPGPAIHAGTDYLEISSASLTLEGGAEAYLDSVRNDLDSPSDSRVLAHYRITLDGHPGREFVKEWHVGGEIVFLYIRTYLVENRVYTITWGTRERSDDAQDMRAFLASFHLE